VMTLGRFKSPRGPDNDRFWPKADMRKHQFNVRS
jgi:hypothetical protein